MPQEAQAVDTILGDRQKRRQDFVQHNVAKTFSINNCLEYKRAQSMIHRHFVNAITTYEIRNMEILSLVLGLDKRG